MKISYRTHPILRMLEDEKLSLPRELLAMSKDNVRFVTKPFSAAIEQAWSKFPQDTWQYVIDEYGILVSDILTLVYAIEDLNNFALYVFNSQSCYRFAAVQCVEGVYEGEISEKLIDGLGGNQELAQSAFINELFVTLAFVKFVEIERKTLPPKSRDKSLSCKYINDSRTSIEVLDCKWYTELHQPNGFLVRGHFRWQPHGEGLKQRKMIWINDFEKSGYTAPARKISANP